MADELTNALAGLQYTPLETGWGIGAQGVAQALPTLVNPYASPMQNLGVTLGGALVASLLGYQAQKEASQSSLDLMTYANKMQAMPLAQERTDYIKSIEDPMYQGRLASLATALNTRETESKLKLQDAIGLETGKLKAIQSFYNTPEGIATREFELRKIEEEAKARRNPLENILAAQALKNQGAENVANINASSRKEVATMKEEGSDRRKQLEIDAKAGNIEKQQAFKREMDEKDKEWSAAMIQLKADVGVNAAREKAQELAALEMQLINEGNSPDLAKLEARAIMTKQINQEAILAREESTKRLQAVQTEEVKKRETYRRQLELENPKIPAALVTQSAKRVTAADMALGIADDLEKFANWTTYRVGTAFTAADEALLKSRIRKLTAEERLALSGTATNETERADIDQMLNGDFSAGPESKAALLRRFALDSKKIAVSNMKGGSQNVGSFVKAVEDSIASGSTTNFAVNQTPEAGLQALEQRLKALQEKRQQLEKQKGVR
jgi:hypothetical protein